MKKVTNEKKMKHCTNLTEEKLFFAQYKSMVLNAVQNYKILSRKLAKCTAFKLTGKTNFKLAFFNRSK